MNRYAPELALITGGVLGGAFGGFVLFVLGEFYSAAVVCALFGYPFAAYAVHTDDDPTSVLPPRAVTAIAVVVSVGVVADTVRLFGATVDTLVLSSVLAVGLFVPVAAYATRYGEPPVWLSPRGLEVACVLIAGGLLVGSVVTGVLAGTVSAVVVFVAGSLYGTRSTETTGRQRPSWHTLVAGFVVAGGLLGVGVATGGSLDRWMGGALAAVFGPLVVVAMTHSHRT